MTKRVLITGANGQLGHEMRNVLNGDDRFEAIFTDVAELDICDAEAVNRAVADNRVDYIVNCAAYTQVDKAEDNVELCRKINATAVENLARAAAACGARMIHVSTDYVFNGRGYRPYTEDMTPDPQSVYGSTKLEGEQALMRLCPQSAIIRTAWLYSPYGNNFVKTMMRLGTERDELSVVADQIGTPTCAADLARAILADRPIVVLDEATAFSDPENEHLIQKAFERLMAGRTVIMIAHRLSTVAGADQIVVIDGGRAAERGRHEGLLAARGTYARMWERYTQALSWGIGSEAPNGREVA